MRVGILGPEEVRVGVLGPGLRDCLVGIFAKVTFHSSQWDCGLVGLIAE